jgi:pimeloyl-ACP methyl ester carboxylesterase
MTGSRRREEKENMIAHSFVSVNGARIHLARVGRGHPLLLLHGWPEIWLTWEPVMLRLADRFELIAPDLRGFGTSDKPDGLFGPSEQAADLAALINALHVGPVGLVAHDIAAGAAQVLARRSPELLIGLFFFDLFYPGIGGRIAAPERLPNLWHWFFHQTDLAVEVIGASPEGIRIYITSLLRQWSHRKDAFDDVLEEFVEAYQAPGNLAGGFAHYRAVAEERMATMAGTAPSPAVINLPTCVRWPEHDPLLDYGWIDRLPEFFADLDLALFEGVGHYPHRELPDRAAMEIAGFFSSLEKNGWHRPT